MSRCSNFLAAAFAVVLLGGAAIAGEQGPAVSRAMEKPLKAAVDAMNAKKYDEAIRQVKEAESTSGKSAYDQFVMNEVLGKSYASLNKLPEAYTALGANADSQFLQAKGDRYKLLATIAFSQKNYGEAVNWGSKAVSAGDNSNDTQLVIAQSYFLQNKYKEAATAMQELIARAERAGQRPAEKSLALLWECYRKLNDQNGAARVIEKLLTYYPKPDYWANAMVGLQQGSEHNDRLRLQVYRLMQDVGTLKRSDQYAEMAQLAQEQGFPAEAQAVLEQGMAKNVFTEQRDKERAARLLEAAKKLAEMERQGLAKVEQQAMASSNGELLVAVGSSYLINGNDPAKAANLISQGIAKGGLKNPNDAYLNLGLAQVRSKNLSDAQKSFGKIDNDEGAEQLAKLWTLRQRG